MSKTAQEGLFILLKVIKRHEEKRPEDHIELTKLRTVTLGYHFKFEDAFTILFPQNMNYQIFFEII